MIKRLSLIKDYYEDEEEQTLTKFNPREEYLFQKAYKEMATKQGLSLDPDDPLHYYDYRALYKETGRLEPDKSGHFPSKYKLEGHPNMYVNGEKEKEKPGWIGRTRGIGELPKYEEPDLGKLGSIGAGIKPLELEKEEDISEPPKIKRLSLIKEKEEAPPVKPEEADFSTPLGKIQYYESKIDWLEGIAKEKGYLGESGYDAYRYAIEQYNKALKEYKVNQPLIEGLPMSKPEDKFPGFEKVEDTKLSAYKEPEKTLLNKVGDLLKGIPKIGGETPEVINARAQVSLNISQQTGIPATTVNQNLDKITKELGIRGIPTTGEFVSEVIKWPIIYSIVTNPVYTTIRIGEFLALTEGINKVGSLMGKWEYKFMAGKGVKDLLPEETNQFTKDVVGVAELLGKAYLIGKFNKGVASLKLWDKFTKDLTSEYHLPQKVVISAEDSKLIRLDEFEAMGIKGKQVLSARE